MINDSAKFKYFSLTPVIRSNLQLKEPKINNLSAFIYFIHLNEINCVIKHCVESINTKYPYELISF